MSCLLAARVGMLPALEIVAVNGIGKGQGDTDTISLTDMTVEPPRVVSTVSVGQTP